MKNDTRFGLQPINNANGSLPGFDYPRRQKELHRYAACDLLLLPYKRRVLLYEIKSIRAAFDFKTEHDAFPRTLACASKQHVRLSILRKLAVMEDSYSL